MNCHEPGHTKAHENPHPHPYAKFRAGLILSLRERKITLPFKGRDRVGMG